MTASAVGLPKTTYGLVAEFGLSSLYCPHPEEFAQVFASWLL